MTSKGSSKAWKLQRNWDSSWRLSCFSFFSLSWSSKQSVFSQIQDSSFWHPVFTTSSDSADVTTCLWLNGRLYCHPGYVSISPLGHLTVAILRLVCFSAQWAAVVRVFVTFLMSAGRNFIVSQQTKVFFQSQFFYLHRETHKRTHAHLLLTFTWVQTCFRAEVQKHTMQLLYGGKASAHSSIYTCFKKQSPERCGLDLPLSSLWPPGRIISFHLEDKTSKHCK